jgi:hypothetical protein
MKPIKFANMKCFLFTSDIIKKDILKNNIFKKNYKLLNNSNLDDVKNNYLFSFITFGLKFFIYFTTINDKRFCFFINKKTEEFISVRFKFHYDLYLGTIFDGELFKDNNGLWIFTINDIYLYKDINLSDNNFIYRRNILNNIFNKEYIEDDINNNFKFNIKKFYSYNYLHSFIVETENNKHNLNFKISGLLFKGNNKYCIDYAYIYPDNRTNNINNNLNNISTISSIHSNKNTNISINKINNIDKSFNSTISYIDDNVINKNCLNNINAIDKFNKNILDRLQLFENLYIFTLLVKNTDLPDVYEIFSINSNENIYINYALVRTLAESKYLYNAFLNNDYNNFIIFDCLYSINFNKFIPFRISDNNITPFDIINHIINKI